MDRLPPLLYWSSLNSRQKEIYKKTAEHLFRLKRSVSFPPLPAEDADEVVRALHKDHPELFYVDFWSCFKTVSPLSGNCQGLIFSFLLPDSFITAGVHKAEESIQEMRQRMRGVPRAGLYRAIAKEMAKDITYKAEDSGNALLYHSIYGAMTSGSSVCEGISKLYLLYCQHMGLPCALVVGTLNGEDHAWNMIESGGRLMYIDVTNQVTAMDNFGMTGIGMTMSAERLRLLGYAWDLPRVR